MEIRSGYVTTRENPRTGRSALFYESRVRYVASVPPSTGQNNGIECCVIILLFIVGGSLFSIKNKAVGIPVGIICLSLAALSLLVSCGYFKKRENQKEASSEKSSLLVKKSSEPKGQEQSSDESKSTVDKSLQV